MTSESTTYISDRGVAYTRDEIATLGVGDPLTTMFPEADAHEVVAAVVAGDHATSQILVGTAAGRILRFPRELLALGRCGDRRAVVCLDPGFPDDAVVGAVAIAGDEDVLVLTKGARVLIFPVAEVGVVETVARGDEAIRLEAKDRVVGLVLVRGTPTTATFETASGQIRELRSSKYPVTSRGNRGYAVLQRGEITRIVSRITAGVAG